MLKNLQKNVLLKNYTSFKIGGQAKYFLKINTNEKLIEAIKWAKKHKLPFFILGGGSNLLVADEGYEGLVINFQFSIFNFQKNKIIVGAGMKLEKLINASMKTGLTGLEWAVGIPGTMGGAVRGNIEAFGSSISQLVKKVQVFDAKKEEIKIFNNKDCEFKYKNSIFKQNPNLIILSVEIKLKKCEKEKIKKRICDNLNYRAKNHPLNFPSAGCVFKNYESKIASHELVKQFPELKEFNKKKIIPAGWLIEKCGLKGSKVGGAEISQKHANFIINSGQAKANDVLELIKIIKKKVIGKFKIKLEEEIQYLGF